MSDLDRHIREIEKRIADGRRDLHQARTALAEVKAAAGRAAAAAEDCRRRADDLEQKAIDWLKKAQAGRVDTAQAEAAAQEALYAKEGQALEARRLSEEAGRLRHKGVDLQTRVNRLQNIIETWQNELVEIRARGRAAQAEARMYSQDSDFLSKAEQRVAADEDLAAAYEAMNAQDDLDARIDRALGRDPAQKAAQSLAELKKKMGLA